MEARHVVVLDENGRARCRLRAVHAYVGLPAARRARRLIHVAACGHVDGERSAVAGPRAVAVVAVVDPRERAHRRLAAAPLGFVLPGPNHRNLLRRTGRVRHGDADGRDAQGHHSSPLGNYQAGCTGTDQDK